MQRSRIYVLIFLLVAVLGAMIALKTMSGKRGSSGADGDDDPIQIKMVSSRPAGAGAEGGGGAADTGTATAGDARSSGVAVSLVTSSDVDAGDGGDGEASGDADGGEVDGELPPMAAKGAAEGIGTTIDRSWFPEKEAAEWFAPLERDFQDARPLTPERYKEVLADHHERIGDVLKRSAEIGDTSNPDDGMQFLEAWNELVDSYKAEAHGG